MSRPSANVVMEIRGSITYTPPTPEQAADYRLKCRLMHGGTYWPRVLQSQGDVSKETADRMVVSARMMRRLGKSKAKRAYR